MQKAKRELMKLHSSVCSWQDLCFSLFPPYGWSFPLQFDLKSTRHNSIYPSFLYASASSRSLRFLKSSFRISTFILFWFYTSPILASSPHSLVCSNLSKSLLSLFIVVNWKSLSRLPPRKSLVLEAQNIRQHFLLLVLCCSLHKHIASSFCEDVSSLSFSLTHSHYCCVSILIILPPP